YTTGQDVGHGAIGITFAGKLYENFVGIAATARLYGRLSQSKRVDAALDGLERLRHGRFLNAGDGARTKRPGITVQIAGGRRHVPFRGKLSVVNVAELRELGGIDVANQDVRVVDTAHFIEMNIFRAQQGGQAVHGRVRLLRDGFLDLNLEDEVRAALEVEAELDLFGEIVLHPRDRGREHRVAEKEIDTEQNDGEDEKRFPLQIGIHGQKVRRVVRRRVGLFCIFRCLHLSNRRTCDANFNLRFAGDFQNDRIAIDTVDGAIDATVGDDFIAGFEVRQHRLHFFALTLL